MATIKDIAKRAGVSAATVSYVLNHTREITPETKARVMEAVEALDYVPNAGARSLRTKRSNIIGLLVPDISNPFYPDLAKGCEDVAYTEHYDVMIFNTNGRRERMEQALMQLKQERVDGIVVASATEQDRDLLEMFRKSNHPFILVHRRPIGVDADYVTANQYAAVEQLLDYLRSLGHHRIAFEFGINGSPVNQERYEAFCILRKKQEETYNLILKGDATYQNGYDNMQKLLRETDNQLRPTAVLACNDLSAFGMMDAAIDAGLKLPEDISITGFDDLFLSESRSIQLTTVRLPRYEMGQLAVKALIDKMKGKVDSKIEEVLPVELVVRKTTGKAASALD